MAKRTPRKPTAAAEPATPKLQIPMAADGIGSSAFWDGELEESTKRVTTTIQEWKANLSRYEGVKPRVRGFKTEDAINVNVQFYSTEQKKPQLFFQVPQILPKALRADSQAVTPLVQSIINRRLEPDDINAAELVACVLDDCLITAGIGGTKVGYDEVAINKDIPTGRTEPAIDPVSGLPQLDMLGQPVMTLALDPKTGEPETESVKTVIWNSIYWRHIPPADLRFPVGFVGADYDAAPWLAWRFNVDENFAAAYKLNAGAGQSLPAELTLLADQDRDKLMTVGSGYEIWYKAHLYDPTEPNPERIRRLVIVSASRRGSRTHTAIVHENSPYQVFDEDGRFLGGMKGFPLHPACIRPLTERLYPKSDCSVLRDVADEKSLGRTLMIQQRKRNLPLRGFNKNAADADSIRKLENAEVQELIAFTGDPREQLFQLPQTALPPENFSFDAIIQGDIDRLSASGSNQQGLTSDAKSATESALIQKALETRMAKERNRLLSWFTAGAAKVFALIQMFASDEDVALVVGEDGAEQYRQWKRSEIQGRFAFQLKPDSALRIDADDERNHFLRFFNLTANHPQVDSAELIRVLAGKWGIDPNRVLKPPAPPPPPPEPERPKLSLSLKGEDLNPYSPQYANIVTLLKLYEVDQGLQPPGAPQGGPPAQPGPPSRLPPGGPQGPPQVRERPIQSNRGLPPIDQHTADLTGRMPGPRGPN